MNLVIVCCHGIWTDGPSNGHDESEWLIADFQRGEAPTFIAHAKAGVDAAAASSAVLIFSGGPSKKETELSEAQSYANLVSAPSLVEPRALDSYHNILYSLTQFWSTHRAWPETITIVSHAFKEERLNAHCRAIGFPLDRVRHIGIDPPGLTADPGVAAALSEWAEDPHGRGKILAGKRARRNPHGVWQGIFPQGVTDRGGLVTEGYGENEVLADAPRPWT